jgi:glutamine cyclotransferase
MSRGSGGLKVLAVSLLTTVLVHEMESRIQNRSSPTPVQKYQVVRIYPHDKDAFTQGLVYLEGYLYESTGLNGRSAVRKVQLETGMVLQEYALPSVYFGEGLTSWGLDLVQLTWKNNTGLVYDRATLKVKRSFSFPGEGWGLTSDGSKLIMSDGTATLRFLDPRSYEELGRLTVRDRGQPMANLNELEFVRGEIYANVWQTDRIARISPKTGEVVSWIDMRGLLRPSEILSSDAVLNGIAYDAERDRLFVTGKLWPKLFEIKVTPQK